MAFIIITILATQYVVANPNTNDIFSSQDKFQMDQFIKQVIQKKCKRCVFVKKKKVNSLSYLFFQGLLNSHLFLHDFSPLFRFFFCVCQLGFAYIPVSSVLGVYWCTDVCNVFFFCCVLMFAMVFGLCTLQASRC